MGLKEDALRKLQLERLKQTIALVMSESKFYQRLYKQVSSEALEIKTLKDIEKLPLITEQDLILHGEEMLCVSQSEISRIVTMQTSGTSQKPKRVYFTKEDQEKTIDYFRNGLKNIITKEELVLILMPCERPGSIGILLKEAVIQFGGVPIAFGLPKEEDDHRLAAIIEKNKVNCIVALPAHMEKLLKMAQIHQELQDKMRKNLNSILLSADYIPDQLCHRLESAFDCKTFEHYGMTEMGLGGAVSCDFEPNCKGYHVREEDLYFEILRPETLGVAEDGEYGEIVFTTLTRKGMPLIRYRTGDYSRWRTSPCACNGMCKFGGHYRKIDKIGKRDTIKGYLG